MATEWYTKSKHCHQNRVWGAHNHTVVIWVVVKIMVPFWVRTLNTRCRIIIGVQKGTIILTTTHIKAVAQCRW